MKQRLNSMIMIVTIILIAFFYHYFKYKFPKQNEVVALVGEEKVHYSDYEEFIKKQDIELNSQNRDFLLDNLVAQKILLKYAELSGIRQEKLDPEFAKEREYTKKMVILDKFFEFESYKAPKVRTKDLKKYYKTNIFYKIRAINIEKQNSDSKVQIERAYQKLQEGENFIDVHHQFFPNGKDSNAGLVGVIVLDEMSELLKEYLSKLKKAGDYTPIIETELFYSIYYRDNYPDFAECKEYILKKLSAESRYKYQDDLYQTVSKSISFNYYAIRQMRDDSLNINIALNNESLAISNLTDSKLFRAEFMERLSDLYLVSNLSTLSEKQVQDYVYAIFIQKVIYDYAIKRKFEKNPLLNKLLAVEYKKLEEKQSEEIMKYLINNFISTEAPTEEDIHNEYSSQIGKYRKPDLFKLQEIYLSKREVALKVQKLALEGRNFDDLVQKYSESEDVKISLGKTPYLNEVDLGAEYKTFLKYKTNEISPIRQDLNGYYVITKILHRQPGATPPLEAMKNEIISRIMFERINEKLNEITDDYQIYVKKYYDRLNPRKVKKVRKMTGWD